MDWQVVAMWLVVGAVVIWIAAGILRKRIFRGKKDDSENGKPSGGCGCGCS